MQQETFATTDTARPPDSGEVRVAGYFATSHSPVQREEPVWGAPGRANEGWAGSPARGWVLMAEM
jgi:hypothetical protein